MTSKLLKKFLMTEILIFVIIFHCIECQMRSDYENYESEELLENRSADGEDVTPKKIGDIEVDVEVMENEGKEAKPWVKMSTKFVVKTSTSSMKSTSKPTVKTSAKPLVANKTEVIFD